MQRITGSRSLISNCAISDAVKTAQLNGELIAAVKDSYNSHMVECSLAAGVSCDNRCSKNENCKCKMGCQTAAMNKNFATKDDHNQSTLIKKEAVCNKKDNNNRDNVKNVENKRNRNNIVSKKNNKIGKPPLTEKVCNISAAVPVPLVSSAKMS